MSYIVNTKLYLDGLKYTIYDFGARPLYLLVFNNNIAHYTLYSARLLVYISIIFSAFIFENRDNSTRTHSDKHIM